MADRKTSTPAPKSLFNFARNGSAGYMPEFHGDEGMFDITGCDVVEIQIRGDGEVLWVNVDGICRLRICQIRGRIYLNGDAV